MKGVIRDTALDHLIRVMFKQDPALPARDSLQWPPSYNGTPTHNASKKATENSISPQDGPVVEKEVVPQPSKDTLDGLERGVTENVVGWCGPDDPEVVLKFHREYGVADSSYRTPSTSRPV